MEITSYWNRELLPILLINEKIFFHEILNLTSKRYIQNISLLADFIDSFLLNGDDVLSVERYNKLADFTCSLKSLDFKNTVSVEQNTQQKKNHTSFVFELHVDKFYYEAVVTTYWNASYLKEKFLSQEESLSKFENSFIFLNDLNKADNASHITDKDYKYFLFRKPLLTFHEAACIMTGYDPQYVEQCQNDTNFKLNFSNYLGAYDYISTCIDAQMLSYDSYSNRLCTSEFKQFLTNAGNFVDGFNDGLDESKSNIMDSDLNTQKIISNLELDLAIEKNEVKKLNEEIDHLKAHIAELESKKMQFLQKENATNDEEINLTNSDLLLISVLLRMLQNEIRVKGNKSQSKILLRIEDEHRSIKGLSKSRTEKVLANANSLYKALINNQMK